VPEGHTLHRLATALGEAFGGHRVRASSPQGRFAESAALLDGRVLGSAEAYGKHLFLTFDETDVVHVHLGLYGRFDVHRDVREMPEPVGQVRLRLVGDGSYADLRGAPACELFTPTERAAMLARLGPDPLRADADPDVAWARIRRSRAPIAGLLMDQTVVAGIGNVYRAELLYRQRVDPFRPGRSLRARQWREMWGDLVALMADGVRTGRIDTVRPEHLTDAELDARHHQAGPRRGRSYVYRRAGEPCRVCGTRVRTRELQARNLYWCARCQRRFQGAGATP
jgi:endonuclease VIII